MGLTELYNTDFRLEFCRICLTISHIRNYITSRILGVSLCMSTRWYCEPFRSPWSTHCPMWRFGKFGKLVAISLIEHKSVKPDLTWIFTIIQNSWIFGRSVNNEKCSKLDFLPPRNFPDFSSLCRYFYCTEIYFQGYLKFNFHWRVGPTSQLQCRPGRAPIGRTGRHPPSPCCRE
jgi:hypothetical protein